MYSFKRNIKKWLNEVILLSATIIVSSFACAQGDSSAYRELHHRYDLFHPVPKKQMKEMETDRPDVTENAYTVPPGHFQVESDLCRYARSRNGETVSTAVGFNLGNYKLGISERADIQLVISTYVTNDTRERNTGKIISRTSGFDDISLRFKYNLWGYRGGKTALAVLPFVSFPTSSFAHNGVQGGITLPFAWQIKEDLDFGTQAEMDAIKQDDNNYHFDFLYSATLGKSISSKLDVFAEGVASFSSYFNNTNVYTNAGIIFSASANFRLDAAINYGINRAAESIFFLGFSFRL